MIIREGTPSVGGTPGKNDWFGASVASLPLLADLDDLVIGIPGESGPTAPTAGAISVALGWPGAGPVSDPWYLLHQDTGSPYDVAGNREPSFGWPPVKMIPGEDPDTGEVSPDPNGELFGWATAS